MDMSKSIEQLEQENDLAVRAREEALNARLRATSRGASSAELAELQAHVDRSAEEARRAGAALGDAERAESDTRIERDVQARAELYGITREQAADELTVRRLGTGVIRDR
jgi:hypothetical protein